MTEQLDFWAPIEPLEHVAGETIEQRFRRFHARNPHILAALVTIARRMKAAGRDRLGIAQLYEILRYERLIYAQPNADDDRRLNNSFRAHYARLIMAEYPDLGGVFETRKLRAA